MNNKEFFERVDQCVRDVRRELHARWNAWKLDPTRLEVHEAIGALMARQVTLFTQLANNPGIWNGHVAPLILRSMVDTFITYAWIWGSPAERAQQFILYGLGQEKLHLEHLKAEFEAEMDDPERHPYVEAVTTWIDSQRWTFLTDVNVGSWSGKSTRSMAEEANCMGIYNYAYQPFSAAVHAMWNHIAKYNLQHCQNPLHRFHRVPIDPETDSDPDYLYRAGKYVQRVFDTFDEKTGLKVDAPSFFDALTQALEDLSSDEDSDVESSGDHSA